MKLTEKIKGWFSKKEPSKPQENEVLRMYTKSPRPRRTKKCPKVTPPWTDNRNGQSYFSCEYKVDYTPKSEQPVVRRLSVQQMTKVVKAEQDPDTGKPSLNIVRKTVDDVMSRTVPFGTTKLETKLNHERIWNEDYSRDLASILYVLGFNNLGIVDGTWIYNHHCDIEHFLDYMQSIGANVDWDREKGEFHRMLWGDVKSASWLLFHAGCYKGKPSPYEYPDDLFREAERRAIEEEQRVSASPQVETHTSSESRYARPPTKAQIAYANQIYHRLLKSGYANVGLPDLRTFGTVGRFIGTWQDTYHQLGGHGRKR